MSDNPFDKSSRYLINIDPARVIDWLLGMPGEKLAYRGWLDTQNIPFPGEPDRFCDTVAHLENVLDGNRPWAVPVEIQISPDPDMFGRLLIYLGHLYREKRPDPERGSRFHVGSIVINLTGRGDCTREMDWTDVGLRTQLHVVEHNLSTKNANDELDRIESDEVTKAILPWIVLMQGGGETDTIEKWVRLAESEEDSRKRSDYGALASVLSELTEATEAWDETLKDWTMIKSRHVEQWKHEARQEGVLEGRAEERADKVVRLLVGKFEGVPEPILERIRGTRDLDLLDEWFDSVLRADTLETALDALDN